MLRRAAFTVCGLLALTTLCEGWTVSLAPGERSCFVLSLTKGTPASGNFELLEPDGNVGPLFVRVTEEAGPDRLHYQTKGQTEGTFSFEASADNDATLCLFNGGDEGGKADGVSRSVGFAFRSVPSLAAESATEDNLKSLVEASMELTEGLANLVDHQSYMRQREEAHRDIAELTNARVLWWTTGEALVLAGASLWQIYTIRQFFEQKRFV
jgi:hypothetical protein